MDRYKKVKEASDEQVLISLSPVIENAPYGLARQYNSVGGNSKGSSSSNSHSSNSSSHSSSSRAYIGNSKGNSSSSSHSSNSSSHSSSSKAEKTLEDII